MCSGAARSRRTSVCAATTTRTILSRGPGLQDVLPRLTVPTVILMGAQDALYPPEGAMQVDTPEAVVAAINSLAPA